MLLASTHRGSTQKFSGKLARQTPACDRSLESGLIAEFAVFHQFGKVDLDVSRRHGDWKIFQMDRPGWIGWMLAAERRRSHGPSLASQA